MSRNKSPSVKHLREAIGEFKTLVIENPPTTDYERALILAANDIAHFAERVILIVEDK